MQSRPASTRHSSSTSDLARNIRNIHKKLAAVAKTEAIVTEFSNLSLDQLVAQKKINNDQRAQVQKKPQLEAQVAQLEEQQKNLTEYFKAIEAKHEKEKAELKDNHDAAVLQARSEATDAANTASSKQVSDALRIVVQFLHAAAYKRQSEDVEPDEAKAYEGVLFHLYQGNATSHDAITKLVNGSDERIMDPHSAEQLEYTYAQLKVATITGAEAEAEPEPEAGLSESAEGQTPTSVRAETSEQADPTITNAALTELEDTTSIPVPEVDTSVTELETSATAPEQASVDIGNAVAEAAWGGNPSETAETAQSGDDLIQMPRDLAETETGSSTLPATQQSTTNWADEAVAAAADAPGPTPLADGDGFSEVRREHRGRGRNAGRGGRGFDGRGRGRGRGGDNRGRGRGGRGGPRGGAGSSAVPPSDS